MKASHQGSFYRRGGLLRSACLLFFLHLTSLWTQSSPIQWRIEDGGNGHYYELVGNYLDDNARWNWRTSKRMAEGRSFFGLAGHLVTITSQAENDFIIENIHKSHHWPTWIGLTDDEEFGGFESFGQPNPQTDGWVWVTGESVTFTGWEPGAPDQTQSNEDAALMGSNSFVHHLWNDSQPGDHAPFIVEYESFDNDLFANRAPIFGLTFSGTNSNAAATKELGEPIHAGNSGGKSIWWTWPAPRGARVTVSTAGSTVDTVLAVYRGESVGNLSSVASNDDDPAGGTTSLLKFWAQPGVTYQIAVDTFGGKTGTIILTLSSEVGPTLRAIGSGQNIVLSWTTNAVGFAAESRSVAGGAWSKLGAEVVTNDANYLIKLPTTGSGQFYRLVSED